MTASSFQLAADPESPRQVRQAADIRRLAKFNRALGWSCLLMAAGFACFAVLRPQLSEAVPTVKQLAAQTIDPMAIKGPVTDGQTAGIKNIFEPVSAAAVAGSMDFSSQYKVVGIILDDHPQAVLKDRETGKSFFVHKGDRLGEATVGDIEDGKVVLSFSNKNWELKP